MKTILRLTKIQMGSALDFISVFKNKKKERKKKAGAFSILTIAFVFFTALSTIYSLSIAQLLEFYGKMDILPGMMMAVSCLVILVTTIYKTNSTLFSSSDYDTLMALPVKTSYIIASRIAILYILNIFFVLVIMLPSTIIYGIMSSAGAGYYIYSMIGIVVLPIVPMIAASVFGVLFGMISARFRHKNIVNIILVILLFIGLMYFYFNMGASERIIEIGTALESLVRNIYPLAGMYMDATTKGDIAALLLFFAISAVAFILFAIIVGKLFVKMHTLLTAVSTKRNYKIKEQKVRSQVGAILTKELKRLFSSVNYIMNSTVGLLMLVIGLIAICIVPSEQLNTILSMTEEDNTMIYIIIMAICLCVSMVTTTACSISLEGKNLWVIKSLPIAAKTFFRGKILFNILLAAPFIVIAAILSTIVFKPGIMEIILLVITPSTFICFTSVLGLKLNLRFPLLDWTNEAVVVKQSVAVMITLFSGMIISIVSFVLLLVVPVNPTIVLFALVALLLLISWLLFRSVDKKAEEKLYNL